MRDTIPIAMAVACLTLLPLAAGGAFTVSPMELHMNVEAGARGVAGIDIANTGDRPLTLKLYLSDCTLRPDGSEENLPPGTVTRSCAPWATLADRIIELGPGEQRRTALTLEVPPDAEGSYWSKVYIEEISAPQPSETIVGDRTYQVFLKQRIGVRIFENPPGTEVLDARVTDVTVARDGDGPSHVTVSVENTGNTLLRCSGNIELRDSRGTTVETMPLGSGDGFSLFPNGRRDLKAPLSRELSADTYTALALVDFGGPHVVAGDAVVRVAPDRTAPGIGGGF